MRVLPPRSTKGFLVEFGPDAGTGAKGQETNRLAAVAEGHDEQPRAPIFPGLRIADHGTLSSVVDLRLFSRCRDDHGSCLHRLLSPELADKAFDGLIASAEAAVGHQVLPDRRGIATLAEAELDSLTERLAGGGSRGVFLRYQPAQLHAKPGGHLIGRF
jgi:hypothetical protein